MIQTRPAHWPQPPDLEGSPPLRGDPVTHPEHGDGRFSWTEWRDLEGQWVDPTGQGKHQRDERKGQWWANVTTETSGYRCPLSALKRR